MNVSVICTVRNEALHIDALLGSLAGQDVAQIIIVDAGSEDGTWEKLQAAKSVDSRLRIVQKSCRRGEGRNVGARLATGDLLAFIDGDCVAEPGWAAALAKACTDTNTVVAGSTRLVGPKAYTRLHRVELPHKGQDTTWPSCNLAYPADLFRRLGGFDASFVTAEDIDLNFRAVSAGARIVHAPDARVQARTRDTLSGVLRQAYWNGFGRKQLTLKHGRLWQDYKFTQLVRLHAFNPIAVLRLAAGLVGYLEAKRGRHGRHKV